MSIGLNSSREWAIADCVNLETTEVGRASAFYLVRDFRADWPQLSDPLESGIMTRALIL